MDFSEFNFQFAGQTPIMLAEEDDEMVTLLKNHLQDVQNTGPSKMPWKFKGAWEIYGKRDDDCGHSEILFDREKKMMKISDSNENGFNIYDDVPTEIECKTANDVSPAKFIKTEPTPTKVPEKSKRSAQQSKAAASKVDAITPPDDVGCDLFEIEESEAPLVPLYHLRDEGMHKWVLLSDLCYVLKVKSKDALLKQVSARRTPDSATSKHN